MHKDKRVEKKKTVTMKRCLNPVFNESFPFDVPAHVLRETTIIITVMDKDRLSRNDVIGKVTPHSTFCVVSLGHDRTTAPSAPCYINAMAMQHVGLVSEKSRLSKGTFRQQAVATEAGQLDKIDTTLASGNKM